MTFRSPGVAGDILLLILLIPIAAASLAFLLLFPLVALSAVAGFEPTPAAAYAIAIGASALAIAWFVRRKLFWTLTLGDESVVLGRWLPRRIPYDRVRFVLAGALANPMVAIGRKTQNVVPLAFSVGLLRTERIFLTNADAARCVRALHARAPHASAIDADGTTYGPKEGTPVSYASFKLAETLIVRALVTFGMIALAMGTLAALAFVGAPPGATRLERLNHTMRLIRSRQEIWAILAAAPALAGYGTLMLRKARRVVRGEFDQSRT